MEEGRAGVGRAGGGGGWSEAERVSWANENPVWDREEPRADNRTKRGRRPWTGDEWF